MIPLPGKNLVAAGVALAAASGFMLWFPAVGAPLAVAWALLIGAAAWDFARLHGAARAAEAYVEAPGNVIRGTTLMARTHVENHAPAPLRLSVRPLLPVQADPPEFACALYIPPGEKQTVHLPLGARVRGNYTFGAIFLRAETRWRLARFQRRIDHETVCRVLPDIERVKDYIAAKGSPLTVAPHLRTARFRGIGSEFESLREFEQGDEIRRIDWKATAKHRRLIVRNYEIEPYRNVMVLIDRGRLMAARAGSGVKLDYAIDAALMIAGAALDSGDRCGVLVFDENVTTHLKPQGGLAQLNRINELLFDVQPALVESHFRRAFMFLQTQLRKRSLVVVLTDVLDQEASRPLITGARVLGRQHLVVTAALRTPELEAILSCPIEERRDPFRKAVVYRLRRERGEVMMRLRKGGAHVLDVDPESLTLPLVNKYIELREMNLL